MADQVQGRADVTLVGIDIAKRYHAVAVERPDGRRERFRMANSREDHDRLVAFLASLPGHCLIGLEATGDYHRPLAYRLAREGFEVCQVSTVAGARYREARYNSRDKNDPKDAVVILELMKQGLTQRYYDPLIHGIHDLQELSKTYLAISRERTHLQHTLVNHYLTLYFPEMERFWCTTRNGWLAAFLLAFPTPDSITTLEREAFIEAAWPVAGRKVNKRAVLSEIHDLACRSIALPLAPDSVAVATFRLQLERYQRLNNQRAELERDSERLLGSDPDYQRLRSVPGIGPVIALTVLAEAGDLRRFAHHRQFLKYCGLDLAKSQSGEARGRERLSKRGNARLRSALWMAAQVAVRQRENAFRHKYDRYLSADPSSPDRKRKALTAVTTKMARVIHALIKTDSTYRNYYESALPRGSIPVKRAVEAARTS